MQLNNVPVVVAGVHSCSTAAPQYDRLSFVSNDDILTPELGDLTETAKQNMVTNEIIDAYY